MPSEGGSLPRRGPARAWDAGPEGRAFLDRICARVTGYLKPGGVLLLVQNALVGEQQTLAALRGSGLQAGVALRHLGKLGPRLRARAEWLRARGLLDGDADEVLIIRAQAPSASPVHAAHQMGQRHLLG